MLGVETGTEGGTALFTPVLWEDPAVTADKKSSNSSADIASLAVADVPTSSSKFIRVVLSRSALGSAEETRSFRESEIQSSDHWQTRHSPLHLGMDPCWGLRLGANLI